MAHSYLSVDRDQVFLLPPDMREWLPEGHLVWFVLEVVERVDTAVLHDRRQLGGVGRRGYDPDMLLALLVYAYCTGQRSSRQIERLCGVDVAYRVIAGNRAPDHTTIARFRRDHEDHAVQLFTDVLMVCAEAGLASVGLVAVDGTKMAANASAAANRTRAQLEAEVGDMFVEAGVVDADQDRLYGEDRGDELPPELRDRSARGARLDAALRELQGRAERQRQAEREAERAAVAARAAVVDAAWQQGRGVPGTLPGADAVAEARLRLARITEQVAQRRAALEARYAAQGRKPPGFPPSKPKEVAQAEAVLERAQRRAAQRAEAERRGRDTDGERVNVTDPDSRMMKSSKGWVQGYNAQAAVNEHGVVVAAGVTQDVNDSRQCVPMMDAVRQALDAAGITNAVEMMLFDAGYWSDANATAPGPDRLIATTKDWKRRKALREQGGVTGPPPADATVKEAMEHRLCTTQGATLYARRAVTVEPVFGQHKHNRGFRDFVRRGLAAAQAEWLLIHATGNLLKAFHHRTAPAVA